MAQLQYFYGAQTERIIKHLIRLFGGFTVLNNHDDAGNPVYRRVPCRYGDISTQSASILQGNSENTLKTAPFITISINRFNMSRENIRSPLVEDVVAGINKYDSTTGQYTDELESVYQIKRQNPVPWDLEFNVDVWTTTSTNKFELFEQIATLFNPAVELQVSTNPHDWTSKMTIENTGYTHSSRAFPQGSEYNLDIATFNFKTTIWLSLPVAVSRAKLINQITMQINAGQINDSVISDVESISIDVYAPSNHNISVYKSPDLSVSNYIYYAKLLGPYYKELSDEGEQYSWEQLIRYYNGGDFPDSTQLRLLNTLEGTGIVGEVALTAEPNVIEITIDDATMEPTTDDPIDGIIDPSRYDYDDMVSKSDGTRFIVHDSVERFNLELWNQDNNELFAEPGDIIEKTAGVWGIASSTGDPVIVDNQVNWKRYKYLTDVGWHELIKSKYSTGLWRLGFPI